MFTMSRTIISWLCIISLISQSGCAHKPTPPLSDEVQAQLGTVGVVSAKNRSEADLDVPAKGWLGGAGRKSLRWMGKGALGPLEAGHGCNGDNTGLCGLLIIALSITAGTIGALAGGVAGAIQAEPSKKVAFDEEVITTVIASLKMQEALCDRVVQVAQCETCDRIVRVPVQGPAAREEKGSYASLAAEGIDTVLEIAIPRFALSGEWDINPSLQFQMDSHILLVRTSDDKKLYDSSIEYRGSSMTFSEWADNNAQAFFQELDKAYQSLANKIDAEVFYCSSLPDFHESGSGNAPEAK